MNLRICFVGRGLCLGRAACPAGAPSAAAAPQPVAALALVPAAAAPAADSELAAACAQLSGGPPTRVLAGHGRSASRHPVLAIVDSNTGFRNFYVHGPVGLAVLLTLGVDASPYRARSDVHPATRAKFNTYQTSTKRSQRRDQVISWQQWAHRLRFTDDRAPVLVTDPQQLVPYLPHSFRQGSHAAVLDSMGLDRQLGVSRHPHDNNGLPLGDRYLVPGSAAWRDARALVLASAAPSPASPSPSGPAAAPSAMLVGAVEPSLSVADATSLCGPEG